MAKTKTTFFCQNCGTQFPKWIGKCNSCNEWNTIVEEVVQKEEKRNWKQSTTIKKSSKALKIKEISISQEDRIPANNDELNRVLGGGIVKGSVILLGGEPGIGKSTLLLQIALLMQSKVLYVSGEESQSQIKLRAERLEGKNENCLILTETKTQNIFKIIEETIPDVVVIDSIQTLHTDYIEASPGSISQIRETTAELIKFAKETNTPVILIGHITKEGTIAGPKILEHMVDVVLQFEGDRNHTYRILRAQKNRFGSTAELGIYEMSDKGLREVIVQVLDAADERLPTSLKGLLRILWDRYIFTLSQLKEAAQAREALVKQLEPCKRLLDLEGVGPVCAARLYASLGDGRDFKKGRHASVYIGLTPKQHSSGGKTFMTGIDKNGGDKELRAALSQGAFSVINKLPLVPTNTKQAWLIKLVERVGLKRASIALANKTVRTAWAMLVSGDKYRVTAL